VRQAVQLQLPVYLAGRPPAGMTVIAPLRASARGPGAHLDALLEELDRRAVAMRAEAVAVRAIRVGGETTLTEVPRPCSPDLPLGVGPQQRCVEALTGTTLEMTLEADALRSGDDRGHWVAPPPLPGER
jgi:hypothetical protein